MSFKVGNRVREIATGDEGVILEIEPRINYVLVQWTSGFWHDMDFAVRIEDIELVEQTQQPVIFTQSDLQILENDLKKQINLEYYLARQYKHYAKLLWTDCDKNDRETEKMFESFSDARKNYKHRKAKLNQLAALQAKIKRAKNSTF